MGRPASAALTQKSSMSPSTGTMIPKPAWNASASNSRIANTAPSGALPSSDRSISHSRRSPRSMSSSQSPAASCRSARRKIEKNAPAMRCASAKSAAPRDGALSARKRSKTRRPRWFGSNRATSVSISGAGPPASACGSAQGATCFIARVQSAFAQLPSAAFSTRLMEARIGSYRASTSSRAVITHGARLGDDRPHPPHHFGQALEHALPDQEMPDAHLHHLRHRRHRAEALIGEPVPGVAEQPRRPRRRGAAAEPRQVRPALRRRRVGVGARCAAPPPARPAARRPRSAPRPPR